MKSAEFFCQMNTWMLDGAFTQNEIAMVELWFGPTLDHNYQFLFRLQTTEASKLLKSGFEESMFVDCSGSPEPPRARFLCCLVAQGSPTIVSNLLLHFLVRLPQDLLAKSAMRSLGLR
jgi:hypothetical protein